MRRAIIRAVGLVLLPFCACATGAQVTIEKCHGPIYTEQQITRPARIAGSPNFEPIYAGFGHAVRIHAVLDAVLCRSGKVTDIKVVEVSPPEIEDLVVAVVSLINFRPAEMRWHTV